MNEPRETMNEVLTTPSGIVGHRREAQKRPCAPPRVERLIGMNRDTGKATGTQEVTSSGSNYGVS